MEVSIAKGPPYSLISTDHFFYLKAKKPHFKEASFIKINRQTSKVTILEQQQFEEQTHTPQKKTKEDVFLLMGILVVNQEPYLCTVTEAEPVATLISEKVFCINKINFIPFKHKYLYRVVNQTQNEKILQQINLNIVQNNFYFAYHQDITLTYQKIYQNKSTERKYFWNEQMLQMFNYYNLPKCWRIPVVQGHIKQLYCQNEYFTFYYCVISRRSKFMSGTRFASRGIDVNFNASNWVQSQQILICHNYIMTHTSLRGSVPIFWQQQSYNSKIKFSHPDQQNMLVLQNHIQFLKRQLNSHIIIINLLGKEKQNQKLLCNRFQYYLRKTLPHQPYIHYDFNQKISNRQNQTHQIIDQFIKDNKQYISPKDNFFCIDRYTQQLYSQQQVVTRINCLDCLDRTNVIMSRLSLAFIQQAESFINSHTNMVQKKLSLGKKYKEAVTQIWVQLGNRISMIYSGTQSTAAHLTKQEESSFFSFFKEGIKSISRLYQSSVNDQFKQTCIDFLLGNKQQNSKTKYFDDNIVKSVLTQHKYCSYQELTFYALTWNCNTVDPDKISIRDLDRLFNFAIDKTDLIIICLQEMVQLSSFNVLMGNNENIVSKWQRVIEKHLNDVGQDVGKSFVHLTNHDLVGIATFVFVSGTLFNRVYKHEWCQIKTGFNNSLGNKGAIILFMQIDSTFLTFTNCHLTAGQNTASERIQDIEYIHNDALNERSKRRLFDKSQFKFLIGDLNFRLEAKKQNVRQILYTIQKQDAQKKLTKSDIQVYLASLLQKDEYNLSKNTGTLSMYSEPTIYFMPTYKYVKKEKNYDSKRTPAWCDRILFNTHDALKLANLKYWDIDCYLSDHKPVCGAFKILLKKQDGDKKRKLLQQYMQQPE